MMKKYISPEADLVSCYAADVLNASEIIPYTHIDQSSGEWIEWSEYKKK